MSNKTEANRFDIITNPSDEEMKEFQKGLETYNMEKTDGEFNSPKEWLSLVLKDNDGNIVGGIMTSTLYWIQYLEVLWVDDKYRGLGYGRDLVLESEKLAKENGCITSQTYTFSFQAPEFYQAIGYKLIATYDGYVNDITELILMKRLDANDDVPSQNTDSTRFTISKDSTKETQQIFYEGMSVYSKEKIGDLRKAQPEIKIKLIVKNESDQVIGGLTGYTTLGTMNFGEFWVDERYRGQGYGKDLLTTAESIAKEKGVIASQTACFSFQNLGFLKKQGYIEYGVSDGYPKGVKEYFLIKKF